MKGCELCDRTATMHCESDNASLCWVCDAKVHGANFLVARHQRVLLCRRCQSPTPWRAAGPRLGPTLSLCDRCVESNRDDRAAGATDGGDEMDDDDDDDDDEDDEIEEDEEEGENQVVPWSSSSSTTEVPPPPVASSSSSEESSSRRRNQDHQLRYSSFSGPLRHRDRPSVDDEVTSAALKLVCRNHGAFDLSPPI